MIVVLVVENYPATQAAMRRALLDMFDYDVRVIPASCAREAIELLGSIRFDIIISDYDLGETSGKQVLDHLRESLPAMVERFIFFSGSDEAARAHHKVISKDDADKFSERLARLLEGVALPRIGRLRL